KALAEANTLVSKGEFAKAFKMLRALAAKGNTTAQMRLGALFSIGAGVKENQVLAYGWYLTAADHGNPLAMVEVGHRLIDGNGADQNPTLAFSYCLKAANKGDAIGNNLVGLAYLQGIGVA